jgi:hypothetical protein
MLVLPAVNFLSPASAFQHQGHTGTAGHGLVQHCSAMNILIPQSRQSAKPFLQSLELELGLPQPLTRMRVCPPPLVPGGGAHSLAREGGGWPESQFQRGDIHCGTLYMYVLLLCDFFT